MGRTRGNKQAQKSSVSTGLRKSDGRNGEKRKREINTAIENLKLLDLIKAYDKYCTIYGTFWTIETDEEPEDEEEEDIQFSVKEEERNYFLMGFLLSLTLISIAAMCSFVY